MTGGARGIRKEWAGHWGVPYPMEDGTCLSKTRVAPKPLWGGRIESAFSGVEWSFWQAGSASGSYTVASKSGTMAAAIASSRPVIGDSRPTRMTATKKDRLRRITNWVPSAEALRSYVICLARFA